MELGIFHIDIKYIKFVGLADKDEFLIIQTIISEFNLGLVEI